MQWNVKGYSWKKNTKQNKIMSLNQEDMEKMAQTYHLGEKSRNDGVAHQLASEIPGGHHRVVTGNVTWCTATDMPQGPQTLALIWSLCRYINLYRNCTTKIPGFQQYITFDYLFCELQISERKKIQLRRSL